MLKKERHAHIIKQINLHNKVLSADLAIELNVSEDTVRRDLHELNDTGQVVKVHGGALSKSYHYPFQHTNVYAPDAKRTIAQKAISLIKDGMVILTGGGTTVMEMAAIMPQTLQATVFTISPLVALELANHPMINVILIGGELSKESQVCTGPQVVGYLNEIKFDMCFLGTNGISLADGITDSALDIVLVKKAMIRASRRLVIMCITEKLNSVQRMRVCDLSQVSALITECEPTDSMLNAYRRENVTLY